MSAYVTGTPTSIRVATAVLYVSAALTGLAGFLSLYGRPIKGIVGPGSRDFFESG